MWTFLRQSVSLNHWPYSAPASTTSRLITSSISLMAWSVVSGEGTSRAKSATRWRAIWSSQHQRGTFVCFSFIKQCCRLVAQHLKITTWIHCESLFLFRPLPPTDRPFGVSPRQVRAWSSCWQISKLTLYAAAYEYIKTETRGADSNVGLVTLNRPKALNALCDGLMKEVVSALQTFDTNDKIAAIVITGSEKAFAGKRSLLSLHNNKN
mgnify:CR=1 FL=1